MKTPQTPKPPRWAQRLLVWYCRPDLQGDLNEVFDRHCREKGVFRARLIYVLDALKFCRPYTLRKPGLLHPFSQWIMVSSYIKVSGRSIRLFGNVTLRKTLIVTQFTISKMFIAATIIGYKYYQHLLAFDLGFKTENVLNIKLFGNKAEILKKELSEIPEVKQLSSSSIITSVGNYWGGSVKYKDPQDSSFVYHNIIDEHYLPLHGHKLLAGKNFRARPENSIESEVIVNEKLLKRFNIANRDPLKAIGETVTMNGQKVQIIGVVKDFQYGKAIDEEIKEFMFRYSADNSGFINARVISQQWPVTLKKIESAWKKIDDVHPLEATFYDEEIEHSYSDFSSRIKVIGSLAFLAICIAAIGLLSMVVFTTETRLKEISIRKVLGASIVNLLYLLSRNLLVLLAISALIALLATRFFFIGYVLAEYGDSAPIPWNDVILGVATVVGIAFVMIASRVLRVAQSNPADVLKNE